MTILLTLALLALSVEAGLRLTGTFADHLLYNTPPSPDGLIYFEDRIGHLRLPNRSGETRRSEYSYRIRSNSLGFRDEELPATRPVGEFRVMVVGDSIASGFGVREEERFTDVIERRFNDAAPHGTRRKRLRVVNTAVGGHGTIQSRMMFERYADRVDPDAVMLVFATTNDFRNNLMMQRWQLGEELYYLNEPKPGRLIAFLRDNLHIYHLLGAIKGWKSAHGSVSPLERSLAEKALEKMRELCDDRGIPFVVVLATTRNSYPDLDDPGKLEAGFYKVAREILETGGYRFIDTIREIGKDPALESLYYRIDTHPNARGHEKLAEILLEAGLLTDRFLGVIGDEKAGEGPSIGTDNPPGRADLRQP